MEAYIKSGKLLTPLSVKHTSIQNSGENIKDLISLANEELEKKSKLISELQARLDYLEGKNMVNLDEDQLNGLSNFYGSRLSSIVSAITNLNNSKSN